MLVLLFVCAVDLLKHYNNLQEQPLLLEELLEQEKREQEKQQQSQVATSLSTADVTSTTNSASTLLSEDDFERLKADVFNSGSLTLSSSAPLPGNIFFIIFNIKKGYIYCVLIFMCNK